jgi:hypothetical protein
MYVMISAQYFWPESVGAGVWLHQLATDLVHKGHRVTMLRKHADIGCGILKVGLALPEARGNLR